MLPGDELLPTPFVGLSVRSFRLQAAASEQKNTARIAPETSLFVNAPEPALSRLGALQRFLKQEGFGVGPALQFGNDQVERIERRCFPREWGCVKMQVWEEISRGAQVSGFHTAEPYQTLNRQDYPENCSIGLSKMLRELAASFWAKLLRQGGAGFAGHPLLSEVIWLFRRSSEL